MARLFRYSKLVQVLLKEHYMFLPMVTEHVFDFSRLETSRLTVRRTRSEYAQSAANFFANSISRHIEPIPRRKAEVEAIASEYAYKEIPGEELLASFRRRLAKEARVPQLAEDCAEVSRSIHPILSAMLMKDE
jgi:hypothetical protein